MENSMMAWFLVIDGVVIQKQYYEEEGFIEGPEDVLPGYTYDGSSFHIPPPDLEYLQTRETLRLRQLQSGANTSIYRIQYQLDAIDDQGEIEGFLSEEDLSVRDQLNTLLSDWRTYRIALRKVDSQDTWPLSPNWPKQPSNY